MLLLLDAKKGLWVDDYILAVVGEEGLKSSFMQTRVAEGIKKGKIFDASFREGRRSLLYYPSGEAVMTHISAVKIEQLKTTKADETRQLRIDMEVMRLKLNKLTKQLAGQS